MSAISRRTLAKGAAWSVPVVAVATAAPLISASPIVTVSEAGDACKLPGNSCGSQGWNKGYLQPLEICNHSDVPVTITIQSSTLSINGSRKQFTPVPKTFTIAANDCERVILNLNLQDNSTNSSIRGDIQWTWVGGDQSGDGVTAIDTPMTPPCVNCTV